MDDNVLVTAPTSWFTAPDRRTTPCSIEVDLRPGGADEALVVYIAGDIDLLTLPDVDQVLGDAAHWAPAHLIVDVTGVTFCCVRGFTLLAAAAHAAAARAGTFTITGLHAGFDRFTALLWLGQPIVRHRSVADAVAAIGAPRHGRTPA